MIPNHIILELHIILKTMESIGASAISIFDDSIDYFKVELRDNRNCTNKPKPYTSVTYANNVTYSVILTTPNQYKLHEVLPIEFRRGGTLYMHLSKNDLQRLLQPQLIQSNTKTYNCHV